MNSPLLLASTTSDRSRVGPWHNHIGSFAEALAKQGYSSYSIDQKIRLLRELDRCLRQRQIKIEDFAEEHIEKFLCYRRCRGHGRGGLLDVSRIVTGKMRMHMRAVDLWSLVQLSVENMQSAAEAKGIRIEYLPEGMPQPIVCDPDRIQQVVCCFRMP